MNRLPSIPVNPAAIAPCDPNRRTMSGLISPASVVCTTLIVSASVTRNPSTHSGSTPACPIARVICGPPPCTITGCSPTKASKATSPANV